MNDSDKKLDIGSQAPRMPTSLSTGMRLILVEIYTISIPPTFTGFADIYERMKQSNFFFQFFPLSPESRTKYGKNELSSPLSQATKSVQTQLLDS